MIKFSPDSKRLLAKPWLWILAVVISASVWGLCFYWASRVPVAQTLTVWVGADAELDDKLKAEIIKTGEKYGIRKFDMTAYSPNDTYYAAAFALQSPTTDLFILEKTEAATIAQTGVFKELDGDHGDRAVTYDGKVYGVIFAGDYCVLISAQSRKDAALLNDVFDAILSYGEAL